MAEVIKHKVVFHRPYVTGRELDYVVVASAPENIGSDGSFTQKCAALLERRLGSNEIIMTSSCTGALELAARTIALKPGDEVIMPSFTFSSTANAVLLTGATPVFVDIRPDTCNLDETKVAEAITAKTKAICVVHYAGVSCEMDALMALARRHSLIVIEDAAQAVGATYKSKALGTIGHLGTYSFHYTKNIHCGEGGALSVNQKEFSARARAIRDKGTNRRQFLEGHVDKYTWVDIGLSLAPSELASAFLLAQLEDIDAVIASRRRAYEFYMRELSDQEKKGFIKLPVIPAEAGSNYHIFRINVADGTTRAALISYLAQRGIQTTFHYIPLHSAPMGEKCRKVGDLSLTTKISETLIRLPLFSGITDEDQHRVVEGIENFFAARG